MKDSPSQTASVGRSHAGTEHPLPVAFPDFTRATGTRSPSCEAFGAADVRRGVAPRGVPFLAAGTRFLCGPPQRECTCAGRPSGESRFEEFGPSRGASTLREPGGGANAYEGGFGASRQTKFDQERFYRDAT